MEQCPHHSIIGENLIRGWAKITSPLYDKIICTVSGGADSDVMLDIVWKCDLDNKVTYAWFDTGLEYQATKDHLDYLEKKYGIQIQKFKAIKSIPNKYLKEFMIANPPQFKISNKCCQYAKKNLVHKVIAENGYDLEINGVRKAEGGIRDVAYKTCFDSEGDWDRYRPLFWYADEDKQRYEEHYGVIHSRCYTEYGLKRTGCVGCPFGKRFEAELENARVYEPKLYKAAINIFGDSYAYTRAYKKFCEEMKAKEK